jgi:ADP-ribose pyrophosphatase
MTEHRTIRTIHESRVFTVQAETIAMPDGRKLHADIIRHPGSVVLVPVTDGGDVMLVRQYRAALGRRAWELPAGTLERGEEPQRAAARECHEETGLIPGRLERLGSFFPTPGYCDEQMTFFKATELRQPRADEAAHQDEDEDIETRAFDRGALQRMIAAGEIIDLKTVAGLALLTEPRRARRIPPRSARRTRR